ncbi:SWI/SNF-related matrix-associated actin-dependent regulator of chromatin subfamily A-like protein 1 [Halyomorpha halys]|uniref:SWI/SNF-related matrix-associated actin-dependent regulator of chromatin subfamily A-like protein 1 n=1 Tax=Halyomorpha halys TaxID=286706 RepID=UPI0006D4C6B9|nr:SWI/SNF-related matrix-associated actin-dependent regulator of chromatin subfamily A-like protein 1 [Halyomorpha halys]
MSSLTEEQKRRIEENRRLALERRAARLALSHSSPPKQSVPPAKTFPASSFYKPSDKPVLNTSGPSPSYPPLKTWSVQKSNTSKPLSNGVSKTTAVERTWNVTTDALQGTVSLINKKTFVLEIGFNQKLVDICKQIPGRYYDPQKKSWCFPLKEYENFKKITAPLSPQIVIGNLPASVLKIFSNPSNFSVNHKDVDISCIEPTLFNSLFPFQKEGIQFGVSKGGRCMIADEMGLGKTIQALGISDFYRDEWPLLVVCPSSMRFQWEEEIRRNLPHVPSYSIYVLTNSKDEFERAKVVILSYDLMGTKKDLLKSYGFGVMILDECHSLKNIKTKRTKAALELVAKSKRVILLSGTPALSRPAELFTQIKVLQPTLFKDMIEFGIRYCEGKQDRFGWNFNGSSNLEELKTILEEKIMIRRLKSDVLDQLPSKIRQVIVIEPENNREMDAFKKKLNHPTINGAAKRSTLLGYFAETGKSKINSICKYVEQLLSQEKKFLIFAHHKTVMDAISDTLERNKTYYIRIDGSVSSEERKNVSDQFQDEGNFRVAVLSLKAANTGITLTAANLVVFAELFWNPGELIQAEDRAHRIGQQSNVLIQYLIAPKTADDYLWPLVQEKLKVLKQTGLSDSNCLDVEETKMQGAKQSAITDFFSEMDDDVDEEELGNLLDEIEGVQEKKPKLV